MLERFVKAQKCSYMSALAEIQGGKKRTHWMWYIFPQLRGLGHSRMAHTYGIEDLAEAKAYLAHPILSERLIEITNALLGLNEKDPERIFGEIDAMKLQSSLTLFSVVSEENSVFHQALERFFDGKADQRTLEMLGDSSHKKSRC